ncbi:ABC transporter transmembrane region [Treponema bryantii]|uniref:ABC transporter transmembrane region n=1 Tax=Treponema bryantii TaxID=163 RepID=A0A1H9DGA9_9SPIR|nr:ABC transporter ATP-binding protein [Treponema bryantii]SEQ12542.1 ABC transporter transmembrane region [Treponema bryantii]
MIFLTFIADFIFLAVNLVWNKYLANLIDLVTAGDAGMGGADNTSIQGMLFELLIILAAFIFMSGANAFISGVTTARINYELRQNYIESIARNSVSFMRAKEMAVSGGEMTSVLLNEFNAVSVFISENLFFIFDSFIKFLGTFGWFIFLNPFLAFSSNLPVFLIILYVSFSSKILKNYTIKANEENAKLNGVTESLMSLFPVIRLYQAQKFILTNYTNRLEAWEKLNISMEKKKALLMSISAVMTCIPLLLLVLIGGNLVIKGEMTVGELYIFINLSGNVSGILMNMPSFIMQFRIFAGNLQKINKAGEEQ